MKNTVIIFAFALALLAGCASTKSAADKIPSAKGADGVTRPDWVFSGKESSDGIYAVGSGKMSNTVNSLKVAETNGRANLARMTQTTIKSVLTTYAEDTGIKDDVLNFMEEATVERTAAVLTGSTRKDYWQDQDGVVYALMYLPLKAVVPTVNSIIDDYAVDKKTKITEEKVAEALEKYNLLNAAPAHSE